MTGRGQLGGSGAPMDTVTSGRSYMGEGVVAARPHAWAGSRGRASEPWRGSGGTAMWWQNGADARRAAPAAEEEQQGCTAEGERPQGAAKARPWQEHTGRE